MIFSSPPSTKPKENKMREKINPILIDVPMPILTPRLRLEPVRAGNGAVALEALQETEVDLGLWSEWIHLPNALTLSARETWQREQEAKFIQRDVLFMQAFERASGRLVAGTGFHDIDWNIPKFGIGYWVRTSAKGQGYATELTTGLLHYAFRQLNALRVEIYHADGNEASRRVIEKTGFKPEGRLRNSILLPDGRVVDELMYSHIDLKDVPPLDVTWGMP
jgi:ribosomal-protein-serine acetyltransferase